MTTSRLTCLGIALWGERQFQGYRSRTHKSSGGREKPNSCDSGYHDRVSCFLPFALLVFVLPLGHPNARANEPFKAGFAETDITPDPGMEKPGGYHKSFYQKTQDPCKVRAAVFDDGTTRVALVGLDALIVPRALVKEARAGIQAACGIAPEAVLIGASHSHSSGPVGMVQPGEYDHASELVQKLAYEQSSCANPEYLQTVQTAIVKAVCQADKNRTESQCGVGSGHEDKVNFNRRFRMTNGRTFTHPGKRNPEIVEVAGPVDPEVGVIGAWDSSGKLMGCVVNFANHGTTGASGWSANWIYYMEQVIRGALGEDTIVVFLNGDCGDITQVDNLSPYPNLGGPVVGGRVGAEAVKVLLSMHRGSLAPLDVRQKVFTIRRRKPDPERIERCLAEAEKTPDKVPTWTKETLMLDALIAKEPAVEVEVQAIQVGPAVFVANEAEMFVEYGLELRERSPFEFTYPVELANGCVGYVPTEEAMGPRGGGYETRLTSYSNLSITAGRQILDAGLELVRQMNPGTSPAPKAIPPSHTPWSYGNVPPELK
ncbi:MAG: hypothetical protein ACC628_09855 [Pirellulaceae bacterium]